MAFRSEEASVTKSRLRFHDQSSEPSMPPVRSTPDLFKSASREHLFQSSAIRSIISNKENHTTRATNQSFELQEDPSFWKEHSVQVIIRIRPLSNSEISVQGSSTCVRQDSCQTVTWTGHPESRFTFDLVADENVSQEDLFKVAGVPMVENCVGGYNSCMFAYGQTGSGKTHTMLGDIEGGTRRHSVNCGMTPRVFEYLFSRIQKEKDARKEEKLKFTCKCSFLEIYNEQILDLLDPSSINLQIREDTKKGVYVDNLKEIEVTTARDVIEQLVQGAANRKVAATNMNRASSRSHSVFTCIIESKWESQGVAHHRFARLNLVDLAGSERQKSSGAEGERLREATNINKSLSTLGLVIMNLISVSNGKSQHVPYRDSKLTFLLQDSLGGNSKTTIIANISPSTSCSLETLSTLKFAQRAKFIKNHAIVNEDASGDVLAMRIQIQQLKKEVSRLQGLVQGDTEYNGGEMSAVGFLGSPGPFKWEGLHGSLTPLTSDKRMSQRKEYEIALVGAFRREKDKDTALQALLAENQAAMQLAKQREDEIQGLKMRLRFREAGIKRLEAISSGKISAETHLLKEKEELLKEIEVLRAQVDRNQEVTRFAMENLKLKEEIRRLKSFCEEDERERMNEQMMILEDKLLEALDWKLMHESDTTTLQKRSSDMAMDIHGDDNLLASSKEQGSPWRTSINEENEFLRMQAIQNQSEMEGLRKKLNVFLEEKDKLERQVSDLMGKLEAERSSKVEEKENQNSKPEVLISDHMDLKTMVDAIATASQREAEAHETAILLSKENEELRVKFKVLIEDNNKLIELYERAVSENANNSMDRVQLPLESNKRLQDEEELTEAINLRVKGEIESLEHQLSEMHEENEKLLGLYEKAMQERDEFKRRVSYGGQQDIIGMKPNSNVQDKLVEVEDCAVPRGEIEANAEVFEHVGFEDTEVTSLTTVKISEELDFVRTKLDIAQGKLLNSSQTISLFGSLEKAIFEVDNLSREIELTEDAIQSKQHQYASLKLVSSEMHETGVVLDRKFKALKNSLSKFCSSVGYFEQREDQASARVKSSLFYLDQKKEELLRLQCLKDEIENDRRKLQQYEAELRSNVLQLSTKVEEENRRKENERVLLAIDNLEISSSKRNWHLTGKATELLKSEEEKTKMQTEMKTSQEKLGVATKEVELLNKRLRKVESKLKVVEMEVEKGMKTVEEMEQKLQAVMEEKLMVLEMKENGKAEVQDMILEYHQHAFEVGLKEEELKIVEEELEKERIVVSELQRMKAAALEKKDKILEETGECETCLGQIQDIMNVVNECYLVLS